MNSQPHSGFQLHVPEALIPVRNVTSAAMAAAKATARKAPPSKRQRGPRRPEEPRGRVPGGTSKKTSTKQPRRQKHPTRARGHWVLTEFHYRFHYKFPCPVFSLPLDKTLGRRNTAGYRSRTSAHICTHPHNRSRGAARKWNPAGALATGA